MKAIIKLPLQRVLESRSLEKKAGRSNGELRNWLASIWGDAGEAWVLGYADDGVIWGKVKERQLLVAADEDVPGAAKLRMETLHSLEMFNVSQQIHLQSNGDGYQITHISETVCNYSDGFAFDEEQFLLGAFGEEKDDDDYRLIISRQNSEIQYARLINRGGSFHYIPADQWLMSSLQKSKRAQMTMRKYYQLNDESDGWVFAGKRLIDIHAYKG